MGSIPSIATNFMETLEYFIERLEDQYLIDLHIEIDGKIFIPIGGKRIIGNQQCFEKYEAIYFFYMLRKHPKFLGFPNLRFKVANLPYALPCWYLEWGKRIDDNEYYNLSLKERGRLFGYKESVLVDRPTF